MDDPLCQDCGKNITRRMKANVWNEEIIVCTSCYNRRKAAVLLAQNIARMIGIAHAPWYVSDGQSRQGPFATAEVIQSLREGRFDWAWLTWREGMEKWKPFGAVFSNPDLSDGHLELRDFGQGDGTYHG